MARWHRSDMLPIMDSLIRAAYRTTRHPVTDEELEKRLLRNPEARRLVGVKTLDSKKSNIVAWWKSIYQQFEDRRKQVRKWEPRLRQFRRVTFQDRVAFIPRSLRVSHIKAPTSGKANVSRRDRGALEFTVLADAREIAGAYDVLSKRLKTGATQFRRQKVTWPNRSKILDVFWHEKEQFWVTFAPVMIRNRYWIGFGNEAPQRTERSEWEVRCEINPPKSGINRRCAGVFVKDPSGNIYLGHSGRIGGGKPGVGKAGFLGFYRGRTIPVLWPKGLTRADVILLGQIVRKQLIHNLGEFVADVDTFKDDSDEIRLSQIAKAEDRKGSFDPASSKDARIRNETAIVIRRGQPKFRKQLLNEYERKCAFTKWDCEQALEAAHIFPYRGDDTDHITNGLLLRSDLHTLFDLHLIGVSEKYKLVVSAELKGTSYARLQGKRLHLPKNPKHWPSVKALATHRDEMDSSTRP